MSIGGAAEFDSRRAAIAALLRAWRDELSGLARERVPGLTLSKHARLEVELGPGDYVVSRVDAESSQELARFPRDEVAGAALARVLSRSGNDTGRDVTLKIAPGLVLRPQVKLPAASNRTLKSALAFELERLTPIDPSELYFDFVVEGREPETGLASVMLRIVRRSEIDEAMRTCRAAGALVAGVGFTGDTQEGDWTAFPVDRAAWLRAQWYRFGSLALAGLAVFLFIAVIIAGYQRGADANAALDDQVTDAMVRAAAVEHKEAQIERANRELKRLVAQRQGILFVQTLASITRLLPDGAWLTELHLEENKVRADGYSKNASDLIGIVDRSGMFTNAQFGAPLVRNPSDGTDRFELTFDIVQPKGTP